MSHLIRLHPSSRRLLLAAVAFLLMIGLLSASEAAAHTFTKTDGNDSRGRLDIRTASVSHHLKAVVHTVRTYDPWKPKSLENDSFFVIQIDKNNNRRYERCAFIYYGRGRLRGLLSDCGSQFVMKLPVTKLNGTTARISIPKSETGLVYWWGIASIWDGPAPCRSGCVDFSPNRFPDILHDLKPPVVTMPDPLLVRVWEGGTDPGFSFPFQVADAHSGVRSWQVQRSPFFEGSWTTIASGAGGGLASPVITGTPGGRFDFRVVALDRQGNQGIGELLRRVFVPTDVSTAGPGEFSDTSVVETADSDAWGGGFVPLDVGESFTFTLTDLTPGGCKPVELIGPGSGTWVVQPSINGGPLVDIDATDFPDAQRQTLYSRCVSSGTTFTFTVQSGDGFGIDAIVGNQA